MRPVVVITHHGVVNIESLVSCAALLARQIQRYDAVVADFSQITAFDLVTDEIRLLADAYEFSHHPRAIIAPQEDVFGSARNFQAFMDEYARAAKVGVFHSLVEAVQWAFQQAAEQKD